MAHKQGVLAVVGMIFVILSVSLVLPAIVLSLDNPQNITFTQTESVRVVLSGVITTEAVNINSGGNPSVNVTVVNERTGEIHATGELMEGDTEVLEFTGGNITITDIYVISESEAIIQYQYPTYIGYPENSDVIFKNIELLIVLLTIVMLAGVYMVISEVYN